MISAKEFYKLSTFQEFKRDMARMWHLNTTIILVVIVRQGMMKNIDMEMKKKKLHKKVKKRKRKEKSILIWNKNDRPHKHSSHIYKKKKNRSH